MEIDKDGFENYINSTGLGGFGFLTGSRAWGVANENSDYDIVTAISHQCSDIESDLKKLGIPYEFVKIYNSIRFELNSKTYDIVYLSDSGFGNDYNAWEYATTALKVFSEIPTAKALLQNKRDRIEIFNYVINKYKKES